MFKIGMPTAAKFILRILENDNYQSYVVGGCVRDSILGKQPKDWDICTSAKPDEVLTQMAKCGIKTIETGLQHGTVTACVLGENYEITTFRVDGEYSDNRRPDFVEFVGDVVEDLSRRDFTINAMAYNESTGFIDPWGGCGDLLEGIIRCVRNPDDRFREDALRIMRALRFAATYGFTIEEKTAAAIHRNKDLLRNISAERIQSELTKMLCGKGVLDILLEYKDVMAVIIPELEPCIGFDQNNPYHIYDVYDHVAHAVANYRGDDISIKMALLLHDIGKPECYIEDDYGVGHFYEHGVASRHIAADVMTRLRFDSKTTNDVLNLVLHHDADIQPNFRSVRRWLNKIGLERLEKLIRVREADINAQSKRNWISRIDKCWAILNVAKEAIEQQQCFTLKDLAINGHDIMALGVPSGPQVGRILNHFLGQVLDGDIENDHDILVEGVKKYLDERARIHSMISVDNLDFLKGD